MRRGGTVILSLFMPQSRVFPISFLVLVAACAHPRIGTGTGGGGGETRAAPDESCLLSTGAISARSPTITVGLTDAVDPRHAPVPRNDAERIVFRHLYETPVRIDCEGPVLPQLPGRWAKDDGGRRWTLRLRDDARFWDGAPVTAQDVAFGKG